ncbi:hypothetical protein PMZ80_005191 [Knufia obscura]|uniref:feruloyl esterase n=1 Tax=Knufia obscura TaxID=1635080 RepID=A0ABR0RPU9_9EURO|nr:hypothetical protein PMZ80_005191 [Knufia obscura]
MYVQQGYNDDKNKQRRLITDFHGNGGSRTDQYENFQYYTYPHGEQYLVIGIDDLQFTSDLVAHILKNRSIEPSRIYASGKSNGGGFVSTLACSSNGDEFAASAMAALALYIDCNANRGINVAPSCGGGRPRKILQAHGSNDQTIPYDALDNGYRHLPRIN